MLSPGRLRRFAVIALLTSAIADASGRTLERAGAAVEIASPGVVRAARFGERAIFASSPPAAATLAVGGRPRALDWSFDDARDDVASLVALSPGDKDAPAFSLHRRFTLVGDDPFAVTVMQELDVLPTAPIGEAVDVIVPLLRLAAIPGSDVAVPRVDGMLQRIAAGDLRCATYLLGGPAPTDCTPLALPLLDLPLADGRRVAVFTDVEFTTVFELRPAGDELELVVRWTHPGAKIPFAGHTRRIYLHLHAKSASGPIDALMEHAAIARSPRWLRDIALVYFDYLADGGKGWQRDLEVLAARIPEADRGRVVVTLHGWYDRLGVYSYDHEHDRFRDRWKALPGRDDGITMSLDEIRARLRLARKLGFRVLLYFADGTCIDTSTPRGRHVPADLGSNPWNGPEVAGRLHVQNPADPEVRKWFRDYLKRLLRELGKDIDGLVWDETFWIRRQAIARLPVPAHADVAMMTLTRELTEIVEEHDPELAFLTSDNLGYPGVDAPPYALMSHGTFQDSECEPVAWAPGLFANWRKPLWSVVWGTHLHFEDMRRSVLQFGAPVSLANGWADDWGPSEMPTGFLERSLELYEIALISGPQRRPRYLEVEPKEYLTQRLEGELVIDRWHVAGPYPSHDARGLEKLFAPETGDRVAWRPVRSTAVGFVDLAVQFSPTTAHQVAYAESIVSAPAAMPVDLLVGSDDGVRVWLNGALVHENRSRRKHRVGEDLVRGVKLLAGDNIIRVKVENVTDTWGFSVRLQDPRMRTLTCRWPRERE